MANRLRKVMTDKGIKATQMALALGFSSGRLSQYINGKRRPAIPIAIQIAEYLGMSVEELFSSPEDNTLSTNT